MVAPARSLPVVSRMAVVAVLIAACGTGGDVAGATSEAEHTSVFSLEAGMCFDELADRDDGLVVEVTVVDCEMPHDSEVFARFNVAASTDDQYPGLDTLRAEAADRCGRAFEAFVGASYAQSELLARFIVPTQGSWAVEDRVVACYLFLPDGQPLTGTARERGH